MDRIIKLFRRLIAWARRTFVADCPRCHKHFFGFHPHMIQVKFDIHYRIICHRCAEERRKLDMVS